MASRAVQINPGPFIGTSGNYAGLVLSGGYAKFYLVGGSTLQAVYTSADKTGATLNTVDFNTAGMFDTEVYWDGALKVEIYDADDVLQDTFADNTYQVNGFPLDFFADPTDYGDGSRSSASINTALTAISSSDALMIIQGEYTIDANITFPTNVQLYFQKSGRFNIASGVTVTYNGPQIQAPESQIFALTGTGAILFNNMSIFYPEWWGAVADGSTDCSAAFQQAITAINAGCGGFLMCLPKTYKMSTSQDSGNKNVIALKSNVHIYCPTDYSEFDFDGVLSPNVVNSCLYATSISNFKMTGIKVTADASSFVDDGYDAYGVWLKFASNCHLDRCRVEDVENGFIFGAGCTESSMTDIIAKNCYYHSVGAWATSSDPCTKLTFKRIKAYSTGTYAYNCAVDGFNIEETYDSVIDDVTCWNVGVGLRFENSCDNKISNIQGFENWQVGAKLYIDSQRNTITNGHFFDNNKNNEDAYDTSTTRGNDWNQCEGFRVENNCDNNIITNIICYQTPATTVPFTSGSDEPVLGSKLQGATSGAVGRVRKIEALTSGSWAGNDAVGVMHLVEVTGTFNSSEVIQNVTTVVPFNSGGEKPRQGDTIVGATSGATGTILWASNTGASGTDWSSDDASGNLYLIDVTGTFNSSENLNNTTTGTNNVATTNGAATAAISNMATTNGAMTAGTGSNKGFQKYGVGINIRNLTGTDTLSAFNTFIGVQCFNNDIDQIEDRGHYNQFVGANQYANNQVRSA